MPKTRLRGPRGAKNGQRPAPMGVMIGTWRHSPLTNANPYAVWASIDSYKRVFRHIVSEDKDRNPLPGLKSNSVGHDSIDYISPFLSLSDQEVKLKVFEVLGEEPPTVTRSRATGLSQRRQTIQPPCQRLIKAIEKLAFLPDSQTRDTQRFFQAWTRCAVYMPPKLSGTPPSSWPTLLPLELRDDEELLWFLNRFGEFWQILNPRQCSNYP
jgi:hypothetical protein